MLSLLVFIFINQNTQQQQILKLEKEKLEMQSKIDSLIFQLKINEEKGGLDIINFESSKTNNGDNDDNINQILSVNEVKIGKQIWMTENLNVDKFRNGNPIPEAKTDEEWKKAGENKQAAWCYYENDSKNGKKYGKLYNWYAVNDPRGLAPHGWHIPTDREWTLLIKYLGGESVAGGKMKSSGTQYWFSPNSGATNQSGFSGLPGGYRSSTGIFEYIYYGFWWSSSELDEASAWYRNLNYDISEVYRDNLGKTMGLSVRCIKD
jgi:uncharacterized protein (TIGR02145 family)